MLLPFGMRRCPRCDGLGRLTSRSVPCSRCDGEGAIPIPPKGED
jgi:DnaJ-class molecular chaperone